MYKWDMLQVFDQSVLSLFARALLFVVPVDSDAAAVVAVVGTAAVEDKRQESTNVDLEEHDVGVVVHAAVGVVDEDEAMAWDAAGMGLVSQSLQGSWNDLHDAMEMRRMMVAHVEEVQVGSDMVATKVVQMAEMADDGLIERNDPSTVAESDLEVVEVVQLMMLVGGGCNNVQTG